jgi:hypothetical protein
MKRIRTGSPRIRRGRPWPEDLPVDPRDPDVVRAKALAPGIPLTIALSAAVATIALRAAARRQGPRWLPGTEPEPVTVTAKESRPQPAVTVGSHVFHELHPDGRNALCAVCDGQYRSA